MITQGNNPHPEQLWGGSKSPEERVILKDAYAYNLSPTSNNFHFVVMLLNILFIIITIKK